MKRISVLARTVGAAGLASFAASLLFCVAGAGASSSLVAYNVYPLVSDAAGAKAPLADASLVNGWGLSASATSLWWTANNKTNTATLYSGVGSKNPLTVAVNGGPTGTVANTNPADFVISQNGVSGFARFLFATQAGQVLGWSPTVHGTQAIPAAGHSP